jgi:uncharacterized membrane protein
MGSAAAVGILLLLIAGLGRALTRVPLQTLQFVIGTLLLLFGLRWLRKAILRSAGQIPIHDEEEAFAKNSAFMRKLPGAGRWDRVAFATAFQIVMLEGTEVVFIVVAIGAGGAGLWLSASLGAIAALLVVVAFGFALHRPLANVPENKLKFVVGVLLSAFGTFWVGEGAHFIWPRGDWSILGLVLGYFIIAILTVALCRGKTNLMESAVNPQRPVSE